MHSTSIYILWNHCCRFIESMFAFFGKTHPSSKTCCKIIFFYLRTHRFLKKGESFQEKRTCIQGNSGFTACKHQSQWFLVSWFSVGRCRFLLEKVSSSSDYQAACTDVLNFTNHFSQNDGFWITPFLKRWAQLLHLPEKKKFLKNIKIFYDNL